MNSAISISQLAERDAPALMMTEKLVICLRPARCLRLRAGLRG